MPTIPSFDFDAPHDETLFFEIASIVDKSFLRQAAEKPRRDTFYVIFLIEAGAGVYTIDFEEYPIAPNTLFCIAPSQVHYWQLTQPLQGWVMLFTDDLLLANVTNNPTHFPNDYTIFNWDTPSGFVIPHAYRGRFQMLATLLLAEYSNPNRSQRQLAIQSALLLFLINAERAFAGDEQPPTNAGDTLTREFVALVNTKFHTMQRVQHYATELGVTAGHLADTVSEIVGLSPQKVIHKRIVLEAKRLLVHSNLPASTIAEMLAFSDASYFGRFFKREAGETTTAYRQKFR